MEAGGPTKTYFLKVNVGLVADLVGSQVWKSRRLLLASRNGIQIDRITGERNRKERSLLPTNGRHTRGQSAESNRSECILMEMLKESEPGKRSGWKKTNLVETDGWEGVKNILQRLLPCRFPPICTGRVASKYRTGNPHFAAYGPILILESNTPPLKKIS